MRRLFQHLSHWREGYLFPLLALGLIYGAIRFAHFLTGRAVIDDPGALVGFLYNFFGVVLVVMATGLTQQHLFGYRSNGANGADGTNRNPGLVDDLYDGCVTFGLLLFFGHYLLR